MQSAVITPGVGQECLDGPGLPALLHDRSAGVSGDTELSYLPGDSAAWLWLYQHIIYLVTDHNLAAVIDLEGQDDGLVRSAGHCHWRVC